MDPKTFAELEENVLAAIPEIGGRSFCDVVSIVAANDNTGYGKSDAKAALLGLKAAGKIRIYEDGTVCRA